ALVLSSRSRQWSAMLASGPDRSSRAKERAGIAETYGVCDGKAVRGIRAGATSSNYGNRKRNYRGCFGGQYSVGATRLLARRFQVNQSASLRPAQTGAALPDRAANRFT